MNSSRVTSIRQRLRNLSRNQGVDYNRLQLLYIQERWLTRLSQSPHRKQLILKGGLYLYSNFGLATRPTRDIDFLGRTTPAEVAELIEIVRSVASIDLPDGVQFDIDSLKGEENRAATEYGGVRVELIGYLGTARERLQIDIGFGDALPGGPTTVDYPSLLEEATSELLAYSQETVIAEKLQAATVLFELNSRYKDFWDIHNLAHHGSFTSTSLREAITSTFHRRDTPTSDITRLFQQEFISNPERQTQWNAFLKRIGQTEPEQFSTVMQHLQAFLEPLITNNSAADWHPATWSWKQ